MNDAQTRRAEVFGGGAKGETPSAACGVAIVSNRADPRWATTCSSQTARPVSRETGSAAARNNLLRPVAGDRANVRPLSHPYSSGLITRPLSSFG